MAADTPVAGGAPVKGTFRQADRIRKRPHYQAIYSKSPPIFARRFVFYACPNGAGRPRLGVTVPKKMADAVERNRVKRLLRAVFRNLRAALPQDCDLVANAKRSAKGASFAEVEADFRSAAQRLAREGYLTPVEKLRS
jgi:ribonuclease P protein component